MSTNNRKIARRNNNENMQFQRMGRCDKGAQCKNFEAKKMQVASGRVRVKMTLHSVLRVVTVITNRVT